MRHRRNPFSGCNENHFGIECRQTCLCSNNGTCDPMTGSCSCPPGWTGATCGQPCPTGYYGNNCSSSCSCRNRGDCDHGTGACRCPPGHIREYCEQANLQASGS